VLESTVLDLEGTDCLLSVRDFSTRSGSFPGYDDGEELKLELPLAQSAFSPLSVRFCLRHG
jgi:hypothetical protein